MCVLGDEFMCTEGAGDGAAEDFADDFFFAFGGGRSELDELPSTSLEILSVSVLHRNTHSVAWRNGRRDKHSW